MELSERWIQTFEDEGFDSVYEWQDPAGTVYEEHTHKGKVNGIEGFVDLNFTAEDVSKW